MFASVVAVTLRVFCLGGFEAISRGERDFSSCQMIMSHTSHRRLEVPWSRAGVRSEAGSLKIPQDQLVRSEPMRDKKILRVTDTAEANTKFKIHGVQTAVKDTVQSFAYFCENQNISENSHVTRA